MDQLYNSEMQRQSPIVTRPNRTIHFSQLPDNSQNGQPIQNNFSFSFTKTNQQQAKNLQSNLLTIPRAPIIHCFVCDHANAKVKILTDQFLEILTKSGIKVYVERYLTHQPGFQVRAASLNTQADFFFQIHSKTAGAGHVRLYMNGQPKRMTKEEAVASIWSWWRLRCGALTKDETDVISNEKIFSLLKDFGKIDQESLNFTALQQQVQQCLYTQTNINPILNTLNDYENILKEAKVKITSTPTMSTDWVFEQGAVLQSCQYQQIETGLSQPLKSLLISIIDQAIQKARRIRGVINRNYVESQIIESDIHNDDENLKEIPIDINNDQHEGDGSSWKMMIESVDEDRIGSVKIASYGESPSIRSFDRIATPVFLLDEF